MKRGVPFQLTTKDRKTDNEEQEVQHDASKVLLSNRGLTSFPREALYNAAASQEKKGGGSKDTSDRWWLEEDIKYIDLSHNFIPSIPDAISSLAVSLTVLVLSNNKLNSLPESISELSCLKKLDITHNNLVSLPDGLGRLTSLVELNLTGNRNLKQLPELNGLSSIEVLRCAECALTSLPTTLGIGMSCLKLIELDASGNCLTTLPSGLSMCVRMRILRLSRNKLNNLPDLQRLQSCCVIDLRQNTLTQIPCLPRSTLLSEVYLGANRLSSLQPASTHLVRSGISVLDVASNMIDVLPDELRFCHQLTTLDVSNNDLNILPAWLGFMTLLTRLVVDGNPLRTMKKSLIGGGGGVPALKAYLKTRATPDEAILFEKEIIDIQAAKHHIGLAPLPASNTTLQKGSNEHQPHLPMAAAAAAADNLSESLSHAWSLTVREAFSTPALKLIASPSAFPVKLTSFSLNELTKGAQREALERFKTLIFDGHALSPQGIPKDLLAVCVNVSELSFSRNSLERVPDAVTYTAAVAASSGRAPASLSLHTLRLSFNSIPTNGVPWLSPSLINLDLSHNRLKRIPKCLTLRGLPHLESLSLANNDIEAPPEEDLGDEGSGDALLWLPKLRSLNLSGNVLTRLPIAVMGLTKLSSLDISNCDISSLQPHIGCMPSLSHLNIEGNPQRGVRPGVVEMGTPAVLGFLRSRVAVGDEKKYLEMFIVKEEEIVVLQPVNSLPQQHHPHQQQQQQQQYHYQQQQQQQQQERVNKTSISNQYLGGGGHPSMKQQQQPSAGASQAQTYTPSAGMTGEYYQMVRRIEELQNELQSGGGSVAQVAASKRELLLLRAAEARAKQQNAGF